MSRFDEVWGKEKRYKGMIYGGDEIIHDILSRMENSKAEQTPLREIILDIDEEGIYSLTQVLTSIDCDTFDLVDAPILLKNYLDDYLNKELLFDIGNYMANQIPMFGNTQELQNQLEEFQFQIIKNGIKKEGEYYTLKEYKEIGVGTSHAIQKLSNKRNLYPGEIRYFKELINLESRPDINASKFIRELKSCINQFERLLKNENRNENELQRFLTKNPIIFGIDYIKILVKPKLGGEYEMDYALVKFDQTYDLVEIESSNLSLFTKKGQLRSELTHAIQQVMDWLDWIERNNPYAQKKLRDISMPKGFVVIGRNTNFSEEEKRNLKQWNKRLFGLAIFTYDDLLLKAKTLLKRITENENEI